MANVLVVDDDAETLEVSCMLLEEAGHHVQTGHNGKEGLNALADGRLPDCIVLDVEMPVLSGPGMVHQMLLHDSGEEKIPVLLVSGSPDLSGFAARVGTPYFLKKGGPDYGRALVSLLERAIRERQAPIEPAVERRSPA